MTLTLALLGLALIFLLAGSFRRNEWWWFVLALFTLIVVGLVHTLPKG